MTITIPLFGILYTWPTLLVIAALVVRAFVPLIRALLELIPG